MSDDLLPFCECGCGEPVAKKGNRFIRGHSGGRGSKITPKSEPKLCECGCGEYALSGNDYIKWHQNIGKKATPKTIAKMSDAKLGIPHTSDAQLAADEAKRGVPHTPEHNAAIKKGQEDAGMFERQRGGNDIVGHHYIYDHSDLSLNIVKMTRSNHTSLHHLLKNLDM